MAISRGRGISQVFNTRFFLNTIDPDAQDFYDRVIADGGTFEAMPCLLANIAFLKSIDIAFTPMEYLEYRVGLDSGTFEAFSCGNTIVENLQNIEI